MSEKIDNTVDEWLAAWPSAGLSDRERKLVIRNLRDFYSWLRRIEDAKIAPSLRKQIDSHLADMNEHELERLLEFLSTLRALGRLVDLVDKMSIILSAGKSTRMCASAATQ